jgi:hypothetical protein
MPITLTTRSGKGSALTAAEHDANMDAITGMSKGGGFVATTVKTGAYNAAAGECVRTDSSGGIFTVTLPGSPADGDAIQIEDATGSWGTNAVTLGRNGSNIDEAASNFALDGGASWVIVRYHAAATNWVVYAGSGGLGIDFATVPADTQPDSSADVVLGYDAGSAANRKYKPRGFGRDVTNAAALTTFAGLYQTSYFLPNGYNGRVAAAAVVSGTEYWIPAFWTFRRPLSGLGIYVSTGVAATTTVLAAYVREEDNQIGTRLARITQASATNSTWIADTFADVNIDVGQPIWLGIFADGVVQYPRCALEVPQLTHHISNVMTSLVYLTRASITLANAFPSTPPAESALTGVFGVNTSWCPAVRAVGV